MWLCLHCFYKYKHLGKFKIVFIVEFTLGVTYLTDNVTQLLRSAEFGSLPALSQGKLKCELVTMAVVTVPEGKLKFLGSK